MIFVKASILALVFLSFKQDETIKPYVASYIDQHKYQAIDEMIRSGIPASITLAQAIIESNAGTSKLARASNNHFGIKCKDYWNGNAYYHPDDDRDANGNLIPSCFRKYETVAESYADHSDFLMNTAHYKPLFVYDRTDYKHWAQGIEVCGYATCDGYAAKLINTIEVYQLHELDYYTIQYVERSSLSPGSNGGTSE